jgi:hypothetical protein
MAWYHKEEPIEYVEGRKYTPAEMDQIATQMLREDANRVLEHTCGNEDSTECKCKRRGIGGDNPILFESHLAARKKREIHTATGVPDPSIISGSYWRAHPEGRPVNSPKDRKDSGVGFYRS